MTRTLPQQRALAHVRDAYIGPEDGENEIVLNRPHLQYVVGMLFPSASAPGESEDVGDGDRRTGDDGEVDDNGAGVPLAEDWRPSSVAISFVCDSPSVVVSFSGGTYAPLDEDGPPRWRRRPFNFSQLELTPTSRMRQLTADDVPVEIGSRWRKYGDHHLVTVHARVMTASTDNDRRDIALMLFQVALEVSPGLGARLLEYAPATAFETDAESAELRLRFRDRKVYAVGHGTAAAWELEGDVCRKVFVDSVPSFVVPAVETTGFDPESDQAAALQLDLLSRIDEAPDVVLPSLIAFVDAYKSWVDAQQRRVESFGEHSEVARDVVARCARAAVRMQEGLELLENPDNEQLRTSFALAMSAMRLQMQQPAKQKGQDPTEPRWRPFQLGFLLVALASTVRQDHAERELVDLIWFPTGGGKTEAYLGLAAIEIFGRRLAHGVEGGGTAVITRYTLRLLTAQQFQRAAALICAMEVLRRIDSRVKGMAPFTIGLWIGNEATPGTSDDAKSALERLHKAAAPRDANQFQVESCPWCMTSLVPQDHTADRNAYGMRLLGKEVVLHCVNGACEFAEELPLCVVDDVLYERPPTILLATVDKFARLQFKPEAGRLLGLGTINKQPSLVIQDELHLLSGPLGTTVAVFDAVIELLLRQSGASPKIIASTATIRASAEQVSGLYGRDVALYPPAGLDHDETFFSRPVASGEGRLYIGLMPQSISQTSALVATAAPLFELSAVLAPALENQRDPYWTVVLYHNSLRELGRTSTLIVDDVNGRLETRADRLGLELREVSAEHVLELTSRRGPEELPADLRLLGVSADTSPATAVDAVLSSNMLSVGIDVPRLSLMLMVGQPKTTAEYIQATSRVGRGDTMGIVATLFRANRARDRSHFETFRSYHEALYRSVEPTSVTPWSLASRQRSLAGAVVALMRHSIGALAANGAAGALDLSDQAMNRSVERVIKKLIARVQRSDPRETEETADQIWFLVREWDYRASQARSTGQDLKYDRQTADGSSLLKRYGQSGDGWVVGDSMRSVEPNVAVEVREPMQEEARRAEHQA